VLAALVEERGAPGRPCLRRGRGRQAWQNAYGESGSAALRRESLNQEVFHGVLDARAKTGLWRLWYKTAAAQRVGVPGV